MHVVIDIETKRDSDFMDQADVAVALQAGIKVPGNYSKPDSIAKYQADGWIKMVERAATRPLTGKIVCIGLGYLHDDGEPFTIAGKDEREILNKFAKWIGIQNCLILWCGWRVRSFDIPFITARSAICDVELPGGWPTRRWDNRVIDLAEILDSEHDTQLDTWLMRMKLPLKTGHGSQVEDMSDDEIVEYCSNDVVRERMLLKKFSASIPTLRANSNANEADYM